MSADASESTRPSAPPPDRAGRADSAGRADTSTLTVVWLIKGLGPGGAEQLLVHHARAKGAGLNVRLLYLAGYKSDRREAIEAAGVAVRCIGGERGRSLWWPLRLRQELRRTRAAVVHIHSPAPAAVARIVSRTVWPRPRVVYTEHNRWPSYRLVTRLANRMTYRLNDDVIAVSSDVAESVPTALRSRVEVIEHGVDVAAIAAHQDRAAARRTFQVDEDHFVVGIVANCRHEKDLETLVGAVAAVDRRRPDSKIVVVHIGQGPLADDLDRWVIEAGVGDRLRRLGRREDAAALMSGFDAFTLSSRHEGLPVALMEAAANGLPMVCTNVGGVAAVCRDGINGVLVASGDPEALADAWMSLAADADECERMARESSRIAVEFDVHRAVAEIEDRYGRTSRPSPVSKGEA